MQSLSCRLVETTDPANLRPWPDRPVRITLVITDLDVGGAERALVALATGLDRTRWDVSVICLGAEGVLAGFLRNAGLACESLGGTPRHPLRILTRLRRAFRAKRPELIQSFLFHANLASRLAAPWIGRPWIVGGLRVAERRKSWHLKFDRLTISLSAGSVCVSEGVRRFSREIGGIPNDRLLVIPNGIDPEPYDSALEVPRTELGIPEHARLALYVGRLDPQKGLPQLLDAAHLLAQRRDDWFLILVGDGPQRAWLKSRLNLEDKGRASAGSRIRWLGQRSDVPGLLKSADLLVLPSLWEGMPNVVLEAMAAGRAVVGTRVEGTEDLVIPGETGWLVSPGNTDELARALWEAAEDPERCRAYGEAGRRRVTDFFTREWVVAAYERLWAGLLGYHLP